MNRCATKTYWRLPLLLLLACVTGTAVAESFGSFGPRPQTEWLDDGRDMQLLRPFVYTDPNGRIWTAAQGMKVDGASIPPALWAFVGGPLEGKYRNASVVHDTECELKLREWRDVHRMFYYAVRAGGVGVTKGKLMYAAVYFFGPRWKVVTSTAQVSESDVQEFLTRMLVLIRRDPAGLPLVQIESESMTSLRKKVPDGDADLGVVRKLLDDRNSIQNKQPSQRQQDDLIRNLEQQLYRDPVAPAPSAPGNVGVG
jgi:hypothetical protein